MKLLLVEDEEKMVGLLKQGLEEEGHEIRVCTSGRTTPSQDELEHFDVILLDWSLPGLDGVSVLRQWREAGLQTPVLMLTARGTTGEKVIGLRAGADDYLVKPFDFDELLARVEALRRRGEQQGGPVRMGSVLLDPRRRVLRRGLQEESLTAREFSLISSLARQQGTPQVRARLMAQAWGPDFEGSPNVLEVYVGYLRTKLERLGAKDVSIRAVRGVGYTLLVEQGPREP
ncbi:two component transcriptional regulator, winged helix family [Cystobacter fuscus DSM 2262]|uniref:Two component transcriptional regulator, winged helix family n=1 Tax=Cystobacter fuscus (strain ATCC 25194 / DSM 2262 / NBRC 100088 / M29) TaxID=1242864 RepID=S9NZA0_CYSF2|nr:response regulator transcription factor [Cystobacter fuscus]EPX55357.1 two component transcriptional regulator, winged helix family [Cystobacter fuscus DSM 2262]